jgi:hypothetical protein
MNVNQLFRKYPAVLFTFLCVLFAGIESLFTFCSKQTCAGFVDTYYDQWFPYSNGQKPIFISQTTNDTFNITSAYKTLPYTSGGFESRGCGGANASVSGNKDSTQLSIYAWQADLTAINISLGNFAVSGIAITDTGIVANPENKSYASVFQNSAILSNKTFANVQMIMQDTLLYKYTVYKIWLAKDKGLVGYQKRLGNELFVLQ